MQNSTYISTTDHEEIKTWAEKHTGAPQQINDPQATGDTIGIRIDFPGTSDEAFMPVNEVQNISWESFFKHFEKQQLVFVYDPESVVYRFIKRDSVPPIEEERIETHSAIVDQLKSR